MSRSRAFATLVIGGARSGAPSDDSVSFREWTEYEIDSDMLTPADAFSFTVAAGGRGRAARERIAQFRDAATPGAAVRVYVTDGTEDRLRVNDLQMTGVIDDVDIDTTRESGTVIRVSGRDRAAYLCDSAAPLGVVRSLGQNATFIELARAICAPWSIDVVTDTSTNRELLTGLGGRTAAQRLRAERALREGVMEEWISSDVVRRAQREHHPLDEAVGQAEWDRLSAAARARAARARGRASNGMTGSDIERITLAEASPRANEDCWSFLARHADRIGIMMWMSARGELVLGAPDYVSEPLYRFVRRFESVPSDPNNTIGLQVRRSYATRFSKVTVIGRSRSDASRARIRAEALDAEVTFTRERVIQDATIRSTAEAQRMADRALAEGRAASDRIEVSVPEHGQGRALYAINTTANVVDEASGIDDTRFIYARTFSRSREAGTMTRLKLVPLRSLSL